MLSAMVFAALLCAELQNVDVGGGIGTTVEVAGDRYFLTNGKIWDLAPHNAFTDLEYWNGGWYCTFREGEAHVGGNGKIRIITRNQENKWESVALLEEEGIDLRDPKISITPDNRLMSLMGGRVYEGDKLIGMQPRVAFSSDGKEWTAPQKIMNNGDWLWNYTWHKGTAYGVSYGVGAKAGQSAVKLVKSTDGLQWDFVSDMQADENCNESTLRFKDDDTCIALIRRDGGDRQAWLGESQPPYEKWDWKPLGMSLGGPEFVILPNGSLLAAGRIRVDPSNPATAKWGGAGDRTMLCEIVDNTLQPVAPLLSGGDCSYPGMVIHEGNLWVSYYTSHEGKADIWRARLRPAR